MKNVLALVAGIVLCFSCPFTAFTQKIYYTDNGGLRTANLDGTGITSLLPNARYIAVDSYNGVIFYQESGGDVYRAISDGSGAIMVYEGAAFAGFTKMDVIPENEWVLYCGVTDDEDYVWLGSYWDVPPTYPVRITPAGMPEGEFYDVAYNKGTTAIYASGYDGAIYQLEETGSTWSQVFSNSAYGPIAVDYINNTLYWVRYSLNTYEIRKTNLTTLATSIVKTASAAEVVSLDVYPEANAVYYSEPNRIMRTDLNGGSATQILTGTYIEDISILWDVISPVFTALSPPGGSTGISTTPTLTMTFSENVKISTTAGSGDELTFRIYDNSSALIQTIARTDPSVTINNNVVTVTGISLPAGGTYRVHVGTKVISDLYGNDFIGINGAAWQFQTVNGVVITKPTASVCVGSFTPLGDITFNEASTSNIGIGNSQSIIFGFSGPGYEFQPGVGTVSFTIDGVAQTASITVNASAATVTFNRPSPTPNGVDVLTIAGLHVRSSSATNPPVNIVRTGGTSVIEGLVVNNDVAALSTSTLTPPPVVTYPNGYVFCQNSDPSNIVVNITGSAARWYTAIDLANEIPPLTNLNSGTGVDLGISTTTVADITRYVTQTVNGCPSPAAEIAVKIIAGPQAIATNINPQTSCSTNFNGSVEVTNVDGAATSDFTFQWFDIAMNPIGTGPILTGIAAGTYIVVAADNNTTCVSEPVSIEVLNNPTLPAGSSNSVANTSCSSPNGSISATITNQVGPLSNYLFTWREGNLATGPIIGTNNPAISGLIPGVYSVEIMEIATQCSSGLIVTEIADNTSIPVTTPQTATICETVQGSGSASVTFSAYDNQITQGDADLSVTWKDNSNNVITTASVSNGGTYNFIIKRLSTGCEGANSMVFTVESQPTIADAGADQSFCGLTTTLAGNTPAVGSGSWSRISGPLTGVFANPSSPTSGFTGVSGDTYVLQWAITNNNSCAVSSDQVTINFVAAPTTANAGVDQNVCNGPVTLAANAPTTGTGAWTVVSGAGGSFANPASPTSGFSGVAGTTYTLRWTVASIGCTPSSDDVIVAIANAPTTSSAGVDQTVCGATVTLAANTPAIGTGSWTVVTGSGGSFSSPASPASTFTGSAGISYTLRWTVTNSICPPSVDDVLITLNGSPTASNAGVDQNLCASSATLAGNTPVTGAGEWTVVSGSGGSFSNPNAPASTFNGTSGTSYTLRWTITNGNCPASTDDVLINLSNAPTAANAGADQSVCGSSVTLSANTPTVGAGQWSVISGAGGTIATAGSASSSFTGTAGTNYSLRWTITNGACPSSADDVLISLVAPPTTAQAGADQTTCGSNVVLAANSPSSGAGVWSIISGSGGSFTSSAQANTGFNGLAGSSYVLRWTISKAGCTPSFDEISVTINSLPQGSGIISPLTPVCINQETTLSITGISGATSYVWTAPEGVSILSQEGATVTLSASSGAGGTITVTPSNSCGNGTQVSGALAVFALPQLTIVLPPSPFPQEMVSFSFESDMSIQNVEWSFGDGAGSSEQNPQHTFAEGGDFEISLSAIAQNGCENTATANLTVSSEADITDFAIKNVITANGDDKNKFLFIENLDRHPENEVKFLDRWGVEIFSAVNYQNNWEARGKDGNFLPAGQYICIVKIAETGKVVSRTVSIIKGR